MWKSKGLPNECIKPLLTYNNSFSLDINYFDNARIWVKFDRNCLKWERVTFTHKKVVNIYIVHEINLWPLTVGQYFMLRNSLFRAVKFTKNADPDKYKYSGNGIGFDVSGSILLSNGNGFGKNVIIFHADMSSSVHIDNKKKGTLILGKDPVQGLNDTTLTEEKEYSINFTEQQRTFCLSLDYNGVNSYLFVNGIEIYKFKAKDSEINVVPLHLCDVSKDFLADYMKKTRLHGCFYDFLVGYGSIDVDIYI